jgi:hypothetical protein
MISPFLFPPLSLQTLFFILKGYGLGVVCSPTFNVLETWSSCGGVEVVEEQEVLEGGRSYRSFLPSLWFPVL